jgi:hypothetical protein
MNEAAFPGHEMQIEPLIAEDDLASFIGQASGTHKDTFKAMSQRENLGVCQSISQIGSSRKDR